MRRSIVVLCVLSLCMAVAAVPASADPPERFETEFAFVFPDFEHGYWVFSNINRDLVCGGEDPFLGTAWIQRVEASDAVLLRIESSDAETWLHEITGEPGPEFNPCDNSAEEVALQGFVDIRANDNDGPNQGNRANSFGDRAKGTLYDQDGGAWRLSWVSRIVFPPDADFGPDFEFDPSWIRVEKIELRPTGA